MASHRARHPTTGLDHKKACTPEDRWRTLGELSIGGHQNLWIRTPPSCFDIMRIRRTVDELPGPGVTATATATEGLLPKDLKEPPPPLPSTELRTETNSSSGTTTGSNASLASLSATPTSPDSPSWSPLVHPQDEYFNDNGDHNDNNRLLVGGRR